MRIFGLYYTVFFTYCTFIFTRINFNLCICPWHGDAVTINMECIVGANIHKVSVTIMLFPVLIGSASFLSSSPSTHARSDTTRHNDIFCILRSTKWGPLNTLSR